MQTWSLVQRGGHFSATLPKIRSAFCAFEPLQQRGVQNAPHVKRVQRQIDVRSCVAGITPSHSTVIHHKQASRYVVLGEISHSPFTTYIFVSLYPIHVKGLTQLSFLVTLIVSTG